MPEYLNRLPTNEELNHPCLTVTVDDSHVFELGKAKGISEEEMWAAFVLFAAGIPKNTEDNTGRSVVFSEDELKSEAEGMAKSVYDEKSKRIVCFLPSPQYFKNRNKNG